MTLAPRTQPTLTRFLIEKRRSHPHASGEFNAVILQAALACKAISKSVAYGALAGLLGSAHGDGMSAVNVQGEARQKLDVLSNDLFLRMNEWPGHLAGMASEEMEHPYEIPANYPRGGYLLVFDPLDGSSNIDVNVSVGSIFSVLRFKDALSPGNPVDVHPQEAEGAAKARSRTVVAEADFLQSGVEQVAAGYALYGPSTILVLSVGHGVDGFTLDPVMGEFLLTHPALRVPEDTQEFAINASNARFWEAPVKRYVDECLAGRSGPRGKDFNMRWIASLVAEAHRILMRGGVFLYPRDVKDLRKPGRLRLLYEANPIGFIIEQAGGRASTGRESVLTLVPSSLHQRIGFVFGSRKEVELIERYHREPATAHLQAPLFAERGLWRE